MDNTRSGRVVWPGLLAVWAAVTVGTVSRLPTTGLPPVVAVLLWPSLLMSSVITLYALKQSVALLLFRCWSGATGSSSRRPEDPGCVSHCCTAPPTTSIRSPWTHHAGSRGRSIA